jgi:hypothetical protein
MRKTKIDMRGPNARVCDCLLLIIINMIIINYYQLSCLVKHYFAYFFVSTSMGRVLTCVIIGGR